MTTVLDKPPTSEQIERIRQVSEVALGSTAAAFEKYGYPSTRGQASEILKRLDRERRWGGETDDQEEPVTQEPAFTPADEDLVLEKTCSRCGETKPLDQYGKKTVRPETRRGREDRDKKNKNAKDGLHYWCRSCVSEPRLSRQQRENLTVRPVEGRIGEDGLDVASLDEAARITRLIADSFAPKDTG